jgi:hypothetical protein
MNALIHRNYETPYAPTRIVRFDDRIEVTNPGGPFGQVRNDNYDRVTDYRNPSLAAAVKGLGYVNRFGRGIVPRREDTGEQRKSAGRVPDRRRVLGGHHQKGVMTSIALFNNKGGVGKTTLAYHLAHMIRRLGLRARPPWGGRL